MRTENSRIQRNLWDRPWGYVESFLIGSGIILTGFLLEYSGLSLEGKAPSYPVNIYLISFYIAFLIIANKWFSNLAIISWLQKVPASISSSFFMTLLVLIMGIIPQTSSESEFINRLGLNRITENWAFLFAFFQFLTCLGLVTIKRLTFFKWSGFGFILNHLGLFIALLAGMASSGDLQRVQLKAYEGSATNRTINANNETLDLPFSIYLEEFNIEEYSPKLALIDNQTGDVLFNKGANLFLIEKGKTYSYDLFTAEILEYHLSSGRIGDRYAFVNEIGAPPSALIEISDLYGTSIVKGWISCGSFNQPYQSLKINEEFSMVMTIPEPKKFSSEIQILEKKELVASSVLEVNKPYNYKGWKLYQLGYDEQLGKWSDLSVIELVRDPWIPTIYTGIFMMIAGAVYMFWIGSKRSKTESNELD